MLVNLRHATLEDAEVIWKMQVEAFTDLLEKYQDYVPEPKEQAATEPVVRRQPIRHCIIMNGNEPRLYVNGEAMLAVMSRL